MYWDNLGYSHIATLFPVETNLGDLLVTVTGWCVKSCCFVKKKIPKMTGAIRVVTTTQLLYDI